MDLEEIENASFEDDEEEFEEDISDAMETEEEESDEDVVQFDISLPASHSYLGPELSCVRGRAVLEAGWAGRVPALAHHDVLFPGETVPMLLSDEHDAAAILAALLRDKLFGLLCPDESCSVLSGYGVVCEVFESGQGEAPPAAPAHPAPPCVSIKARALHRFRLKNMPKRPMPVALFAKMRLVDIVVLREERPPPQHARLAALDSRRRPHAPPAPQDAALRRLDAALTPWPAFVYQIFDYSRMRAVIQHYFSTLGGLGRLVPLEPVALSFWVAGNLALAARDRLALLVVDNALQRLHMECRFIARKSALCCATCGAALARREHALAMSTDGAHSNYTNPDGFVHDVLTVSRARHVVCRGAPSAEFSWFPGYAWAAAACASCAHHVGWRFQAVGKLRPRQFYALCRNYVVPREETRAPPRDAPSPAL